MLAELCRRFSMKKTFKTAFFVSLAVAVSLLAFLLVSSVIAMSDNSAAVGIIGGADGPTAIFITRTLILDNPVFLALCVAILLCAVFAIGWAVTKRR